MKEEELLSFKEELARAERSRYGWLVFGIVITILGVSWAIITSTMFTVLGIIIFIQWGIICCIIAELKYGRDYKDKLKELKKSEKE